MCRHAGPEGDSTQGCAACSYQADFLSAYWQNNLNFWPKCKRYLYSSSICLGQKTLNFREEYVDGAEYLLKHEEDTHIEGQVCKQHLTDTSLYKDTHDKCADNTLWIHLYVCRYF